jgi:hypothetical protein
MSFGARSRIFHRNPRIIYSTVLVLPRALESILLSVLSALDTEMAFLRQLIGNLLAELDDDIDRDKFMRLLHRSRKLTSFQNRAKLVSPHVLRTLNVSKPKRSNVLITMTLSLFALQVQEALEEVLEQGAFHHDVRSSIATI